MAEDLQTLVAGDIMTRSLVCAAPEQPLSHADAMLIEHHISGMPVVDQGRLVGVLSRSDIARVQVLMNSLDDQVTDQLASGEWADGFEHARPSEFGGFRKLVTDLKVKDAMHDQAITCAATTLVAEVARTMVRMHIHRVIVVEDQRPLGIISSLDIVKLLAAPSSIPTKITRE